MKKLLPFLLLLVLPLQLLAQMPPSLNATLDGYEYPYPVKTLRLKLEGQAVRMAYMDVSPTARANGRTVVLLHGKNFFAAYWRETIKALTGAGFRVIAPDQVGFGKSDKPRCTIHFISWPAIPSICWIPWAWPKP
jgi:pimeloyl-ACP methyl ester carboxylesterase